MGTGVGLHPATADTRIIERAESFISPLAGTRYRGTVARFVSLSMTMPG
jgi:hypothetical protein